MIPAGWTETTLKNVINRGSSNLSANKLIDCDGDYPVYGASGLVKKVNFYQQEKDYLAVIKDGAGVGRVYHYEANSSVLGTLQYLFPKPDINIRFAYYFLTSIDYKKYYQGAAIPHIYYKDYCNEKIVLPPLPEQKRIVDKLDTLFADIEKEKQNVQQKLQNAKDLFESELSKILSNDLHWNKKYLKNISSSIQYGYTESANYNKVGPKFLRITDIQEDTVNWDSVPFCKINDDTKKKYLLKNGDIVFARTGATVGKSYLVDNLEEDAVYASYLIKVSVDRHYLLPKFVKYFFMSHMYWAQIIDKQTGASLPNVNGTKLGQILVAYPSIEEQQSIIERLDSLHEQTRELGQIYTQQIADLDELKQAILKKAFNGEL